MPPDGPPAPQRLLAIAQAARIMGIHRDAARRLIAGEVLPAFVDGARRTLTTAAEVENLASARPLTLPQSERPAFVVRPEPATPTAGWQAEARTWAGWATWLDADDRHRGVDRWWAVREPAIWVGRPLLVVIGGLIVEAGRITDHREELPGVRWSVDWADPQSTGYLGTRMPTIRGGPWIAWPRQRYPRLLWEPGMLPWLTDNPLWSQLRPRQMVACSAHRVAGRQRAATPIHGRGLTSTTRIFFSDRDDEKRVERSERAGLTELMGAAAYELLAAYCQARLEAIDSAPTASRLMLAVHPAGGGSA